VLLYGEVNDEAIADAEKRVEKAEANLTEHQKTLSEFEDTISKADEITERMKRREKVSKDEVQAVSKKVAFEKARLQAFGVAQKTIETFTMTVARSDMKAKVRKAGRVAKDMVEDEAVIVALGYSRVAGMLISLEEEQPRKGRKAQNNRRELVSRAIGLVLRGIGELTGSLDTEDSRKIKKLEDLLNLMNRLIPMAFELKIDMSVIEAIYPVTGSTIISVGDMIHLGGKIKQENIRKEEKAVQDMRDNLADAEAKLAEAMDTIRDAEKDGTPLPDGHDMKIRAENAEYDRDKAKKDLELAEVKLQVLKTAQVAYKKLKLDGARKKLARSKGAKRVARSIALEIGRDAVITEVFGYVAVAEMLVVLAEEQPDTSKGRSNKKTFLSMALEVAARRTNEIKESVSGSDEAKIKELTGLVSMINALIPKANSLKIDLKAIPVMIRPDHTVAESKSVMEVLSLSKVITHESITRQKQEVEITTEKADQAKIWLDATREEIRLVEASSDSVLPEGDVRRIQERAEKKEYDDAHKEQDLEEARLALMIAAQDGLKSLIQNKVKRLLKKRKAFDPEADLTEYERQVLGTEAIVALLLGFADDKTISARKRRVLIHSAASIVSKELIQIESTGIDKMDKDELDKASNIIGFAEKIIKMAADHRVRGKEISGIGEKLRVLADADKIEIARTEVDAFAKKVRSLSNDHSSSTREMQKLERRWEKKDVLEAEVTKARTRVADKQAVLDSLRKSQAIPQAQLQVLEKVQGIIIAGVMAADISIKKKMSQLKRLNSEGKINNRTYVKLLIDLLESAKTESDRQRVLTTVISLLNTEKDLTESEKQQYVTRVSNFLMKVARVSAKSMKIRYMNTALEVLAEGIDSTTGSVKDSLRSDYAGIYEELEKTAKILEKMSLKKLNINAEEIIKLVRVVGAQKAAALILKIAEAKKGRLEAKLRNIARAIKDGQVEAAKRVESRVSKKAHRHDPEARMKAENTAMGARDRQDKAREEAKERRENAREEKAQVETEEKEKTTRADKLRAKCKSIGEFLSAERGRINVLTEVEKNADMANVRFLKDYREILERIEEAEKELVELDESDRFGVRARLNIFRNIWHIESLVAERESAVLDSIRVMLEGKGGIQERLAALEAVTDLLDEDALIGFRAVLKELKDIKNLFEYLITIAGDSRTAAVHSMLTLFIDYRCDKQIEKREAEMIRVAEKKIADAKTPAELINVEKEVAGKWVEDKVEKRIADKRKLFIKIRERRLRKVGKAKTPAELDGIVSEVRGAWYEVGVRVAVAKKRRELASQRDGEIVKIRAVEEPDALVPILADAEGKWYLDDLTVEADKKKNELEKNRRGLIKDIETKTTGELAAVLRDAKGKWYEEDVKTAVAKRRTQITIEGLNKECDELYELMKKRKDDLGAMEDVTKRSYLSGMDMLNEVRGWADRVQTVRDRLDSLVAKIGVSDQVVALRTRLDMFKTIWDLPRIVVEHERGVLNKLKDQVGLIQEELVRLFSADEVDESAMESYEKIQVKVRVMEEYDAKLKELQAIASELIEMAKTPVSLTGVHTSLSAYVQRLINDTDAQLDKRKQDIDRMKGMVDDRLKAKANREELLALIQKMKEEDPSIEITIDTIMAKKYHVKFEKIAAVRGFLERLVRDGYLIKLDEKTADGKNIYDLPSAFEPLKIAEVTEQKELGSALSAGESEADLVNYILTEVPDAGLDPDGIARLVRTLRIYFGSVRVRAPDKAMSISEFNLQIVEGGEYYIHINEQTNTIYINRELLQVEATRDELIAFFSFVLGHEGGHRIVDTEDRVMRSIDQRRFFLMSHEHRAAIIGVLRKLKADEAYLEGLINATSIFDQIVEETKLSLNADEKTRGRVSDRMVKEIALRKYDGNQGIVNGELTYIFDVNGTTVEIKGEEHDGEILLEVLRAELKRLGLPEIKEEQLKEEFGGMLPYEVGGAILEDEEGNLEHRGSIKVVMTIDEKGEILRMGETDIVKSRDKVLYLYHTHPHVVAAGDYGEYLGDIAAIIQRAGIYKDAMPYKDMVIAERGIDGSISVIRRISVRDYKFILEELDIRTGMFKQIYDFDMMHIGRIRTITPEITPIPETDMRIFKVQLGRETLSSVFRTLRDGYEIAREHLLKYMPERRFTPELISDMLRRATPVIVEGVTKPFDFITPSALKPPPEAPIRAGPVGLLLESIRSKDPEEQVRGLVDYLRIDPGTAKGVSVLAFDIHALDDDDRLAAALAKADGNLVRVAVVYERGEERLAEAYKKQYNAITVLRDDGTRDTLTARIEREVEKEVGRTVAKTAIILKDRNDAEGTATLIHRDLAAKAEEPNKMSSYAMLSEVSSNENSAQLNLGNLVLSILQAKPGVVIAGYKASVLKDMMEKIQVFKDIQQLLKSIGGFFGY